MRHLVGEELFPDGGFVVGVKEAAKKAMRKAPSSL
jgi:hypothetical protein